MSVTKSTTLGIIHTRVSNQTWRLLNRSRRMLRSVRPGASNSFIMSRFTFTHYWARTRSCRCNSQNPQDFPSCGRIGGTHAWSIYTWGHGRQKRERTRLEVLIFRVPFMCYKGKPKHVEMDTVEPIVVGKCGELNVVLSWLQALNFTFWEEAVQIGVKYWGSYVDTYRERYIFGWYVGESRSGKRTPKRHMLRWDWTMCSEYMLITNLGSVAVIIGRGMCKCIAFGESSLWTFGTFPASQLR